jgi:hypothetical protein
VSRQVRLQGSKGSQGGASPSCPFTGVADWPSRVNVYFILFRVEMGKRNKMDQNGLILEDGAEVTNEEAGEDEKGEEITLRILPTTPVRSRMGTTAMPGGLGTASRSQINGPCRPWSNGTGGLLCSRPPLSGLIKICHGRMNENAMCTTLAAPRKATAAGCNGILGGTIMLKVKTARLGAKRRKWVVRFRAHNA